MALEAIIYCGVINGFFFEENTHAERLATNIFDDEFNTFMDKTVDGLEGYFKYYSIFTSIQGQLNLNTATKSNGRAFLERTEDILRLGEDPAQVQFPITDATDFIQCQKLHAAYIIKSKRVS